MKELKKLATYAGGSKHKSQFLKYYPLKTTILIVVIFHLLYYFSQPNLLNVSVGNKLDNLIVNLKDLRSKDLITSVGLSSYWVANAGTNLFGFKILPINERGSPDIHAIDLMDYWEKKKPIKFTFIINRYIPHLSRWSLNKKSIITHFGNPVKVVKLNEDYEVYLYPNMQTDFIYAELKEKLNRYFNLSEVEF